MLLLNASNKIMQKSYRAESKWFRHCERK